MKMDELRRQIDTTESPILLRVDGKEIAVNSREDLMVPSAGNLVCVYLGGAFEVIDCRHVFIIRREKSSRP
jgi:hypothetical protein